MPESAVTERRASAASALKMPPHNIEAEQSVLGGLMLVGDAWDRVADILNEGDFYRRDHRLIFAALNALVEYAFANHDLVRLHAHVFDWNPASARVLEKVGFTFEARLKKNVTKDGKTIDELVYAMIRDSS